MKITPLYAYRVGAVSVRNLGKKIGGYGAR
jgi:hypothetical protein